jgi:hypothetical protein
MKTQKQNPNLLDYIAGGLGLLSLGIMLTAQTLVGTIVGLGVLIAANVLSLVNRQQPHTGRPPAPRRSRHQQYA